MVDRTNKMKPSEVAAAKKRRLEAMHLQIIEDNPLDDEDIEMFEMFEREAWTHEDRRAYIVEKAKSLLKQNGE